MPELDTALNLAEDFADGAVPHIGPDDVAAVLNGYQGLALAVSEQSKRARAAEARAAAAEAAVRRVRDFAKTGHDQCVHRPHAIDGDYERGVAHALDDVWRLLDTDPGSAGQPVGLAGEGGAAATAPALPADPTSRVMPPEIPLPSVAGLQDGQTATVTATVAGIKRRWNLSNAEYAWVMLRDARTGSTWPVRVSPEGWLEYKRYLAEGAVVTAVVAASTDWNGLTLWLTSAEALDWATAQSATLAEPSAPVLDPSAPGFSPVDYVLALGRQITAAVEAEDGAP